MRSAAAALFCLAALLAAACSDGSRIPAGLGRRVAEGQALGLRPSPDGTRLAWLERCARPPLPQLPQGALACDLLVASAEGGAATRVAEGVSSLDAGFSWGPDGSLAALANHDYATGTGTLVLLRPGDAPVRLASHVGYYGFGPSGILAFVSAGELSLASPGGRPAPVPGAAGIATFEFRPADATELLARRQSTAGGELVLVRGGTATPLSRTAVADYAWSPDGRFAAATARGPDGTWDLQLWRADSARPAATLGRDVHGFAFARDGSALAFLAGMAPGKAGDLFAAALPGGPAAGEVRAQRVATGVGEFRWAAKAARLAWLEAFDPRIRAGTLCVGGPGVAPAAFGKNVTAFDLTPSAAQVAFLEHVTAGGYSVDLVLAGAQAGPSGTVARGVFGFDFSPDGRWLYYRTSCVRNADACDLYRIPATGLAGGQPPERVAEGVKSFEFDRARPERLLVGFARRELAALDLAVWQGARLVSVDQAVLPGSARFLGPGGERVAYVGMAPGRPGVYVARLP